MPDGRGRVQRRHLPGELDRARRVALDGADLDRRQCPLDLSAVEAAGEEYLGAPVECHDRHRDAARQVVTATGSTYENGAANFYALHQDPPDMAETVSMAFMGMSIQCAKCHDHPLEKWTNDQYFAMANLFSRVRGKGWGGDYRNGDGNRTVFTVDRGELIQPRTGKPQQPAPLDGEPIPFDSPEDRRDAIGDDLAPEESVAT